MKQAMMKKTGENDEDVRKKSKLNKNLRKATIFKKAKELSTLCGVDVAVILYDYGDQNPQTWSSQPDNFAIVNWYLSVNNQPQIAQTSNIVIEVESRVVRDRQFIDSLEVNELNRFASLLAGKIEGLNQRINTLRGGVSSDYNDTQLDFNLDDVQFTFDSLDGFDFDDLGFGEKSSNDQVEQVKPMCESQDVDFSFGFGMNNMNDQSMSASNSLGDLEFFNDDALDGFDLDDLRFGENNSDQMILKETQSELDFGFWKKSPNGEAPSQLTSEYSSLADLKFVDDDFDWLLSC